MAQKWNNIDFEITLLLAREPSHVRGIAAALGEASSTISRKLSRLLHENVVGYRTEGKNKVFFVKKNIQARNYVSSAERYKLGKLISRYPKVAAVLDEVLKACRERLIVLFGSHAKFDAGSGSDIDIFIETESRKVKESVEAINSRISVKTGRLDRESPLSREIIKNHVILRGEEEFHERTGLFV